MKKKESDTSTEIVEDAGFDQISSYFGVLLIEAWVASRIKG
ncbi:hypothetical protein [Paenibacillus alvei]|nr:hypothetical protein [Paenibacillus alvei]